MEYTKAYSNFGQRRMIVCCLLFIPHKLRRSPCILFIIMSHIRLVSKLQIPTR